MENNSQEDWKRRHAALLQRYKSVEEATGSHKEQLVINSALLDCNEKTLSLVTGVTQKVAKSVSYG